MADSGADCTSGIRCRRFPAARRGPDGHQPHSGQQKQEEQPGHGLTKHRRLVYVDGSSGQTRPDMWPPMLSTTQAWPSHTNSNVRISTPSVTLGLSGRAYSYSTWAVADDPELCMTILMFRIDFITYVPAHSPRVS